MKYIFQLFICLLFTNCGDDAVICPTQLSQEAKEIKPYNEGQNLQWVDSNGSIVNGTVTYIRTNKHLLSSPENGCDMFDNDEIETNINCSSFRLVIKQRSTDNINEISYSIEYVVNEKIVHVFDIHEMPINSFRDFIYRNVNYYNSIVLRSYNYSYNYKVPKLLIFSKNKGIVYIQFEDDTRLKQI